MPHPKLVQINTSPGGMPKLPVLAPALITKDGIPGDWQKNRKYHGGPDRALCLYSLELYADLRAEGIDLTPGSIGENLTTEHLDLQSLSVGTRLQIGPAALIQLTDIRTPCRNLNQWHPQLLSKIKGRSGWLARVLNEGPISPGDPISIVD